MNTGQNSQPRTPTLAARARCTHERRAGLLIYQLTGELDMDTPEALTFEQPLAGVRFVMVDLSEVTFFGATALNALLHLRQTAAAHALTVHLAATHHGFPARLLDLTGAGSLFPRHASLDTAIDLLA